MPISFPCPWCGKNLRGPNLPGQKVRCPACGIPFTIPDPDGIAVSSLDVAAVCPGELVRSWETSASPVCAWSLG